MLIKCFEPNPKRIQLRDDEVPIMGRGVRFPAFFFFDCAGGLASLFQPDPMILRIERQHEITQRFVADLSFWFHRRERHDIGES